MVRLSYAVRSRNLIDDWFVVDSTNLDELISSELPGPLTQKTRLLNWIQKKLKSDPNGNLDLSTEDYESIAGFIGAKNGNSVANILKNLEADELIEIVSKSFSGRKLRLTSKGYEKLEGTISKTPVGKPSLSNSGVRVSIKADCPECGPKKNAVVISEASIPGSEGLISWSDTFQVIQCSGCDHANVKHEFWLSEWDYVDNDPQTGLPRMNPGIKINYLKPLQKRIRPEYFNVLEDTLSKVLDETYQAFDSGLMFLTSIGTRTAIDRIMVLKVGDAGNFRQTLEKMKNDGYISESEKEILETMIDVGNASAHRGHPPSVKTLNRVLDTIEGLLNRFFVVSKSLDEIRNETPSRYP